MKKIILARTKTNYHQNDVKKMKLSPSDNNEEKDLAFASKWIQDPVDSRISIATSVIVENRALKTDQDKIKPLTVNKSNSLPQDVIVKLQDFHDVLNKSCVPDMRKVAEALKTIKLKGEKHGIMMIKLFDAIKTLEFLHITTQKLLTIKVLKVLEDLNKPLNFTTNTQSLQDLDIVTSFKTLVSPNVTADTVTKAYKHIIQQIFFNDPGEKLDYQESKREECSETSSGLTPIDINPSRLYIDKSFTTADYTPYVVTDRIVKTDLSEVQSLTVNKVMDLIEKEWSIKRAYTKITKLAQVIVLYKYYNLQDRLENFAKTDEEIKKVRTYLESFKTHENTTKSADGQLEHTVIETIALLNIDTKVEGIHETLDVTRGDYYNVVCKVDKLEKAPDYQELTSEQSKALLVLEQIAATALLGQSNILSAPERIAATALLGQSNILSASEQIAATALLEQSNILSASEQIAATALLNLSRWQEAGSDHQESLLGLNSWPHTD